MDGLLHEFESLPRLGVRFIGDIMHAVLFVDNFVSITGTGSSLQICVYSTSWLSVAL